MADSTHNPVGSRLTSSGPAGASDSRIPQPRKGILKRSPSGRRTLGPLREESVQSNASASAAANQTGQVDDSEDDDSPAPPPPIETNLPVTPIRARRDSSESGQSPARPKHYRSVDEWAARTVDRTRRASHQTPSQIPKLSVSWWESNSVTGEAPMSCASSDAEDFDEVHSTHSCTSSIAANWKGKSTRYVTHCDKRHLHHHNDDPGEYLTPTQRKNRLIAELRRQIRHLQHLTDEKDAHIGTLRDRLAELEQVLDHGGMLSENNRLQTKVHQLEDQYKRERANLIARYERQLNKWKKLVGQETDLVASTAMDESIVSDLPQANSDNDSGLSDSVAELRPQSHVPKRDGWTETEETFTSMEQMLYERMQLEQESQVLRGENVMLKQRCSELEASPMRVSTLERNMTHFAATNTTEACRNAACEGQRVELAAQVEAYREEALVWRTRMAETELTYRNFVDQAAQEKSDLEQKIIEAVENTRNNCPDCEFYRVECCELQARVEQLELELSEAHENPTAAKVPHERISRSLSVNVPGRMTPSNRRMSSISMTSPSPSMMFQQMAEASEQLKERLEQMREEKERAVSDKQEYLERMEAMQRQMDIESEKLQTSMQQITKLHEEIAQQRTEIEVSEITLERMRDQQLKRSETIRELEERIKVMENAGVPIPQGDSGVSVTQPVMKRKSKFVTECVSRVLQTELTGDELCNSDKKLAEATEELVELRMKYDTETSQLRYQLQETCQSLSVKNQLSITLNTQLRELQDEFEAARLRWNQERDYYSERMTDVTAVAQKVPYLEEDIARIEAECKLLREQAYLNREEFEVALEDSLTGSLKSQNKIEIYWKEKLDKLEKQLDESRRKGDRMEKELNATKIYLNLEKVDLERKWQNQCDETINLHERVYCPKAEQEVQAQPNVVETGMSALPETLEKGCNVKVKQQEKQTEIIDGDLYDEKKETIKLLQGELATTRKQVEILQHKLIEHGDLQAVLEIRESTLKELNAQCKGFQQELDDVKTLRLDEISERSQLEKRLEHLQKERDHWKKKERQNLENIEREFKLVQQDLESVVLRYETEKREIVKKLRDTKLENMLLKRKLDKMQRELATLREVVDFGPDSPVEQKLLELHEECDYTNMNIEEERFSEDAAQQGAVQEEAVVPEFASEFTELAETITALIDEDQAQRAALSNVPRPVNLPIVLTEHIEPKPESSDNPDVCFTSISVVTTAQRQSTYAQTEAIVAYPGSLSGLVDSGISVRTIDSPAKTPYSSSPDSETAMLKIFSSQLLRENEMLKDDLQNTQQRLERVAEQAALTSKDKNLMNLQKELKSINANIASMLRATSASLESLIAEPMMQEHLSHFDQEQPTVVEAQEGVARPIPDAAKMAQISRWLEVDFLKEKLEFATICQWYVRDKQQLHKRIENLNARVEEIEHEKEAAELQVKDRETIIEKWKENYNGLCRELELYHQEEARRMKQQTESEATAGNLTAVPSYSESALSTIAEDTKGPDWKLKNRKMLQEVVSLEKKFRIAKYEKQEVQGEVHMLRGELEVVRAHYETERDKLLARLEALTGERWTEEAGTDYVRELRRNLEIKKNELDDLTRFHEAEVRRLNEDLFVARAKTGERDYVRQLEESVKSKVAEIDALKERYKKQLTNLRRLSKQQRTEGIEHEQAMKVQLDEKTDILKTIEQEFSAERARLEAKLRDAYDRLKATEKMLTENENYIKIMERELKGAEEGLDFQKAKFEEDQAALKEQIEALQVEQRDVLKGLDVSDRSEKALQREKIWQQELRSTKAKYEADLRSLKREVMAERHKNESTVKGCQQKLKAMSSMLTEKESVVKIMEREMKSLEEGLAVQKHTYDAQLAAARDECSKLHQQMEKVSIASLSTEPDMKELKRELARTEAEKASVELELEEIKAKLEDLQTQSVSGVRATSIAVQTLPLWDVDPETPSPDIRQRRPSDSVILTGLPPRTPSGGTAARQPRSASQTRTDEESTKALKSLQSENVKLKESLSMTLQRLTAATEKYERVKKAEPAVLRTTVKQDSSTDVPEFGKEDGLKVKLLEREIERAKEIIFNSEKRLPLKTATSIGSESEVSCYVSVSSNLDQFGKTNGESAADLQAKLAKEVAHGAELDKELNMLGAEIELCRENNADLQSKLTKSEERCSNLEKESKMLNSELQLSRTTFEADANKLKQENFVLDCKLREALAQRDSSPEVESAIETAKQLQTRVESLTREMDIREERHQQMYLVMFRKGQESARNELQDTGDTISLGGAADTIRKAGGYLEAAGPASSSKHEGLSNEQIVLRFLRDAVYYFLMERDSKDHLTAIMNILKFSEQQRTDVMKVKRYH